MSVGPERIQSFITAWEVSGGAERGNAQTFLNELCELLEVPKPDKHVPESAENAYVFEKTIPAPEGSKNFIDLYKRGCFVLETKQGADKDGTDPLSALHQLAKKQRKTGHGIRGTPGWTAAMLKAHAQASTYVRRLPKEEVPDGRPPFVIVVDAGYSIELFSEFTRSGGEYLAFPDPATARIYLKDLLRPEIRERLRAVWTEPLTLDPSRRSAKVTREIAKRLAQLALSLEGNPGSGTGVTYPPEEVSSFLMRCLFTMFSEDVELLPMASFTQLLGDLKKKPETFVPMLENLWSTMNTGGFSPIVREKLLRFNGGLFAKATALPLNADQIQLLIEASTSNWKDVEPAIFGTLLERALDPTERHKLGAHYTPRAYVERLVHPTVIEPLREEWKGVQVAALQLAEDGNEKKAVKEVEAFLHKLATVRILDPACGSGNFLYVTLELLKRLEAEVLDTLHTFGATSKLELEGVMVTPENFFGIEVNPRAADIAEQVLWIGFLQWHLRTHGNLRNLREPIIKDLHNIQKRDAVLEWDSVEPVLDADGKPVTRWDGRTTKPHPVTGEEVPDPDARVQAYKYHNPRPATWPKADYIVGNPPFIGNKRMRLALGDGYTDALRDAHTKVPESCDFVMYWWDHAGRLVAEKKAKRFGFITTNSITQTFNRKIVAELLEGKKPISLAFAIPDHPWVDGTDGAAVRVAMTVGVPGKQAGLLLQVESETDKEGEDSAEVTFTNSQGSVHADLTTGANVAGALPLQANEELASQGVTPLGTGFRLTEEQIRSMGYNVDALPPVIKRYCIGRDLVQRWEEKFIIDFYGLSEAEARAKYPALMQIVIDYVKPDRMEQKRDSYRKNWWVYAEARLMLRKAMVGLSVYIGTCRTAKHRPFVMLDAATLPDAKVVAIALDDYFHLGVLSSNFHLTWAIATGAWMGVGNDSNYNHSECFVKFPFPAATPAQQQKIRALGEQLDAHRKRQQAAHPGLTMTGMYNVLDRLRAIEPRDAARSRVEPGMTAPGPLNAKEKKIYEQGLVGILRQLHDELDAAVAEAYGWGLTPGPSPGERGAMLSTDEILTRLVALNAERAAEEAKGQVRWLRPEYQLKGKEQAKGKQAKLDVGEEEVVALRQAQGDNLRPWPDELPAQAAALSAVLGTLATPADVATVAGHFEGKKTKKRLDEMTRLLETLAALGRARNDAGGWIAQ